MARKNILTDIIEHQIS